MKIKNINVHITEEEIEARVRELGAEISKDFNGEPVCLICILKGSVFFTCELAKRITNPVEMEFMSVSSYGGGTESSGVVKIVKDLDEPLVGKDVIIVEDIIDSGNTLSSVIELLQTRNPASLTICTLLDKYQRREVDVDIRYTGFKIENEWVFGYGLDVDEYYRNLPFIGIVDLDKYEAPS